MPYGEGYTDAELARMQREYAKTDDDSTYEVTTAKGSKFKAQGINSAKVLAGKDGTIKKVGRS